MNTLKIAHGNGHNEHSLVDWLERARYDSAGVNEGDRLIDELEKIPHATVVVTKEQGDRRQDTPIVVKHRSGGMVPFNPMLRWYTKVVSKALGKPGSEIRRVAPARVLTLAIYSHPLATELGCKAVAHFNVHPDAGPSQLSGSNPMAPITRQYRRTMRELRKAVRAARKAGYLVVVTGDLQLTAKSRRPWAPRIQARLMRLNTWSVNIDWLMYDRRLDITHVVKHPLFDHTGFIATLVRRSGRR